MLKRHNNITSCETDLERVPLNLLQVAVKMESENDIKTGI